MVRVAVAVTAPTVHLNGTSARDLIAGYQTAYSGVTAAIEALQASAPNARDYYVQGPDAFALARTEHESRMHRLADITAELLVLFDAVDAQAAS
jgi:hypothetical protein